MQDENTANPPCILRNTLDFQFQIAWQLLDLHLTGLQDEEFFWRPASKGLHVYRESGIWRAEWPESEEYDIGPAQHILADMAYHLLVDDGAEPFVRKLGDDPQRYPFCWKRSRGQRAD